MRRLSLLLFCCVLLVPVSCKNRRKRPAVQVTEEAGLASMIQAADPRAAAQFVKGFHVVEGNSWRWTTHAFTVTLRPPRNASQTGARLVLKFSIPDVVLEKVHSMKLSAKVNGLDLPPEEYTTPGDKTFTRDVPAAALAGDAVAVDFTLDKFLPPTPADQRELAVIVSAAGLEAK
jgi:hypothetical protein